MIINRMKVRSLATWSLSVGCGHNFMHNFTQNCQRLRSCGGLSYHHITRNCLPVNNPFMHRQSKFESCTNIRILIPQYRCCIHDKILIGYCPLARIVSSSIIIMHAKRHHAALHHHVLQIVKLMILNVVSGIASYCFVSCWKGIDLELEDSQYD